MNTKKVFESISNELDALKDRVRNLIDDRHWPTDGGWKESVFRSFLAQRLPDTVKVGHGFILTDSDVLTTQCDVILYRSDAPVIFRDGDLVILPPNAVLGLVEVKTNLGKAGFIKAIKKLSENGRRLAQAGVSCYKGLFSFDGSAQTAWYQELKHLCLSKEERVQLISIGPNSFVRWWDERPNEVGIRKRQGRYDAWHTYYLKNMAAGYFITNLIDEVSGGEISNQAKFWYPAEGKGSGRRDMIKATKHTKGNS